MTYTSHTEQLKFSKNYLSLKKNIYIYLDLSTISYYI